MSDDLEQKFQQALLFVQNSTGMKLGVDVQLRFYGLYKVAVAGKCTSKAPSRLKVVEYKKWSAYKAVSDEGVTQAEARQRYIDELTKKAPNWANDKIAAKL